jgi:tetratricopeptide (TPR) repeat protein
LDPNPVVQLCSQGMMTGDPNAARALFEQAWAIRADDFDACVAAHYLARRQPSPEAALDWNARALRHADAVGDDRVHGFYPSLHLNLGKSYEDVGDTAAAARHYELAAETSGELRDDGYGAMIRRGVTAGRERVAQRTSGD